MQETSKVRETNLSPAYLRSLAGDIPYSREIANAINAQREYELKWKGDSGFFYMAPFMEFRYKSITEFVKKTGFKQVLEIAAGWSTRGMEMTEDPTITYLETDQSGEEISKKNKIVNEMLGGQRENLHLLQLDALTGTGLAEALKILGNKPTCVVHEGLLRYMLHETKAKIIENIKSVMRATGGVYITPDIITSDSRDQFPNLQKHFKTAAQVQSKALGIEIEKCFFKDQDEAQNFFEGCGLSVERHTQGEFVKSSSSIKNLESRDPKVEWKDVLKFVSNRPIWMMRLK
ncbi:MAG: class I SAM-dependent methyltransferase [Candidatus Micrarchaeota archaeon]|nr:class I SAM-dependent methyltransferase [Candidatus Micrarchaeota archaeon]